MNIFNVNETNKKDINLHHELIVNTEVCYDERNRKIINLTFKLKHSYIKTNVIRIIYNYSNQRIIRAHCVFCEFRKTSDICNHVDYILDKYNKAEIEGALSKLDIDAMFNSIVVKRKEKDDILRKNKMLMLMEQLAEKLSANDIVTSSKLIHLTPYINYNKDKYSYEQSIALKIGIEKEYIVKDIKNMLTRVLNNDDFEYGKNLKFTHNINNFDESSRKCIDTLIGYTYGSNWGDVRKKEISNKALQEIIEAYKGKEIYINDEKYIVTLNDYIPNVSVFNNKIILDDDNLIIVNGNDYDFIIKDSEILKLICDQDMRILVNFIIDNNDFDFELIKDEFAKNIVSRFVDSVDLDEKFKDEFSVKELYIKAYFDYKNNEIILDTKYYIDDEEINEKDVQNNSFISKKYIKYNGIINNLGFENNKLKDINLIGYFLTSDLENLKQYCDIYLSNNIKDMNIKKMGSIKSNISYKSGMLNICFEGLNFSNEELNKIIDGMKKKLKFIKLGKNVILKTDEETTSQFMNVVEEFNLKQDKLGETQTIPLYQGLKLIENDHQFGNVSVDKKIKEMLKDIANYKEANYPVPNEVKGVLRQYQINAYNWLKTLVKYKLCGILADDMGLGKTLEIITLILSDNNQKPSLIISPKSLIYNWRSEFKKWAPKIKVSVISGIAEERQKVIENINNNEKVIYITSYDSLRNDLGFYEKNEFRFCILDEAQFIKNHTTLKAQSVKQIKSEIRFVLTGTPIENTVVDLWSLFDFLMPNYLYNYNSFKVDFEKEIIVKKNNSVIKKLVKKITPFILRRTKKEVLKDLPEKIETIRYATMNEEQRKIYEAQLLKTRYLIEKEKNKIEVLSALTRLRQICVHPKMFLDDYDGESAKIILLMELIDDLTRNNHKVLIFSQFTSIFEFITEKLKEKGIEYFLLTGKTPANLRVEMAEMFNDKRSIQKVFLISLKAGGTGLNLVGADTVIQLDPWWNVAAENQASDRAHRIGQKNVVQVIKLICGDSIEQKVIELQELKKELVDKVIADNDENIIKLNDKDLKYLLN